MKNKFLSGKFLYWENKVDFFLGRDIFANSGVDNVSRYVKELFYANIVDYLDKNVLSKVKDDLFVVFAHWQSNEKLWKIFYDWWDDDFIYVEDLINYIPKTKNILLYSCNTWNLRLKIERNVIYPASGTWLGKTKFLYTESLKNLLS